MRNPLPSTIHVPLSDALPDAKRTNPMTYGHGCQFVVNKGIEILEQKIHRVWPSLSIMTSFFFFFVSLDFFCFLSKFYNPSIGFDERNKKKVIDIRLLFLKN